MKSERNRNGSWERWIGKSSTPCFVIDPARSIQLFNAGCEHLTGWQSKEVLGRNCVFHSEAPSNSIEGMTAGLAPPPEVFSGKQLDVPVFLECRTGPPVAKLIRYLPLLDPKGKLTGLLGMILPIDPPPPGGRTSPLLNLHAELAVVRNRLRKRFGDHSLVCRSSPMQRVLNQIALAQRTSVGLYLLGEHGTGREHIARVIHFGGIRNKDWFVPLDCGRMSSAEMAGILERLVEVHRRRVPSDSRPQPGGVYLANVEELPRDLQEILAREFPVEPSGEGTFCGLRLMASGSRTIEDAIREGKLREDLAAVLSTLVIEIPPLRDRSEDLPLLAQHFLERENRNSSLQHSGFAEDAIEEFLRYNWPGNLDELQTVISEAAAKGEGGQIRIGDLPFRFRAGREAQDHPPPQAPPPTPLDETLQEIEKRMIVDALERNGFNKTKAAEMLHVNRARLYRRMEQLEIEDRETSDRTEPSHE